MGKLKEYIKIKKEILVERGEFCECCNAPSKYIHHIIPVSESSIHSYLVFEKTNMIILCDDCHCLMHPLIRNIMEWKKARVDRGVILNRQM